MSSLREALRTVPRVDAQGWAALPVLTRWAIAARVAVLSMTLASGGIGGLLAMARPGFDPLLWLLAMIGLLAAHASNNLINDYVDSARGLDRGDYQRTRYGTHVLAAGLLDRAQMRRYIAATAACALAAGLGAVLARGGLTLPLALCGAFFVLFYTWPLKALGLGEPAVLLVWGPLMTGGTYYVACGEWSTQAALLGTVYALGPTAVLFGKHIDKLDADAARGIRTLPVLLGEPLARGCVIGLIVAQLALPSLLAASGAGSIALLLTLLALPRGTRAIALFRRPRPLEPPPRYPPELWPLWYAPAAFALTRRMSMLLLGALALEALARVV